MTTDIREKKYEFKVLYPQPSPSPYSSLPGLVVIGLAEIQSLELRADIVPRPFQLCKRGLYGAVSRPSHMVTSEL